jgi:hypothetical protein
MPKSKVSIELGYTYTDISTDTQICYYQNAFGPPPTTQRPGVWDIRRLPFSDRALTPANSNSCMATLCVAAKGVTTTVPPAFGSKLRCIRSEPSELQ